MNHYENVRDAVSDAALGQEPLNLKELAHAIITGLHQYGTNFTENVLELATAIAEYSGEPVEVYNKANEHRE